MADLNASAALVPAVLAGDSHARDRFVELWAADVLRWCSRLGGPGIDAEDATHDVFERALAKLHTMRDPRALPGWLYQLTRRTVGDHRRQAWLSRWIPGANTDRASPRPSPEAAVADDDLARKVHEAIDALPVRLREVLVLCEIEERNAIEVADLVGVPLGTVKSRLRDARARFAKEAARRGLTPDAVLRSAEEDVG